MKKHIIFSLLIFNSLFLIAQNNIVDSLQALLVLHPKEDTIKVNLLNEIAYKIYYVNIDKTLIYAEEAKELAEKLNFKNGKAESLRLIGIYHDLKAHYSKALESYQKALEINREIGNKKGISYCLNNIGIVYWYKDNHSLALEFFQKSLKINDEIGDKDGISRCLNNIGEIHMKLGNNSQAIDYFHKSLEVKVEIGNRLGYSVCLNNIGEIYLRQENYSVALQNFQESLKIRKHFGDNYGICLSYRSIGKIYLITCNFSKALDFTLKSLKIANKLELLEIQKDLHEQLSKIYATTKSYKKAYENYILYKELNDSIFNEDYLKKISSLEYQYKFEKEKQVIELKQQKKDAVYTAEVKRQKIVSRSFIVGFILMLVIVALIFRILMVKRKSHKILSKQKEKIDKDNIQLKELNATKDKFFSIIAHDLRGPLGNLKNFGEIIWLSHDDFDDEKRKELLELLTQGAKETYNLLDNLLKWARSNVGGLVCKPAQISVNDIVNENFKILHRNAVTKKISLNNKLDENTVLFADYDMINTVIRNLISNAVKFTPTGGNIDIISRKTNDNRIEIGVSDSGIGMNKELISGLFKIETVHTTLGTNKERGSGLGLKLCKEFIEKHKGNIWVESEEGKGSIFWINFPVKKAV